MSALGTTLPFAPESNSLKSDGCFSRLSGPHEIILFITVWQHHTGRLVPEAEVNEVGIGCQNGGGECSQE